MPSPPSAPLYVQHDGVECGPYSLGQVHLLIRSGKLSPSDLAQQAETDPWEPLSTFLSPAKPSRLYYVESDL